VNQQRTDHHRHPLEAPAGGKHAAAVEAVRGAVLEAWA
jgi:hypothetical protein